MSLQPEDALTAARSTPSTLNDEDRVRALALAFQHAEGTNAVIGQYKLLQNVGRCALHRGDLARAEAVASSR
jgi:hypothetical protein